MQRSHGGGGFVPKKTDIERACPILPAHQQMWV